MSRYYIACCALVFVAAALFAYGVLSDTQGAVLGAVFAGAAAAIVGDRGRRHRSA